MWRHIASNALSFLVVAAFLAGAALMWSQSRYSGPGPLSEAICLKVAPGSDFRDVSETLVSQRAISSGFLFRAGANYEDKSSLLKAGSFLIPQGTSMQSIVDIVTRGGANTCGTEVVYRIGVTRASVEVREIDPETQRYERMALFEPATEEAPQAYRDVRERSDTRYRVALAEGVTSWQVVEELKSIDLLEGEVAQIPREGSLAPDSYEIPPGGMTRQGLIDRMQERQVAIVDEAWEARPDDLPIDDRNELLTLASIIEKETAVAEERRRVAGVFVNRLRRGMRLQTDPTVIYGITRGQGTLGRGIRQSELRAETPYNTYVIDGLPPTPIANPGRAAIMAAVDPEDTDYVFFVADGTGGHAFAATLEEHNRNVRRWREIEAERANE